MSIAIIVTARAEAELHEVARWYDSRRPGLGQAFLAKFELIVTQIQHFPESFERIDERYRRAILGRFPYFVAYRVTNDSIRILRVMPEKGDTRILEILSE